MRSKRNRMNIHDRRRKMIIGVAFIEEVVSDVLREARKPLNETEIEKGTGLSDFYCRQILERMRGNGEVVNDRPDFGPNAWRLVR